MHMLKFIYIHPRRKAACIGPGCSKQVWLSTEAQFMNNTKIVQGLLGRIFAGRLCKCPHPRDSVFSLLLVCHGMLDTAHLRQDPDSHSAHLWQDLTQVAIRGCLAKRRTVEELFRKPVGRQKDARRLLRRLPQPLASLRTSSSKP